MTLQLKLWIGMWTTTDEDDIKNFVNIVDEEEESEEEYVGGSEDVDYIYESEDDSESKEEDWYAEYQELEKKYKEMEGAGRQIQADLEYMEREYMSWV